MKSMIKAFPLLILCFFLFFNCTFKKGIGDYINKEALYVSTGGNDGNDGTLYTPVRTVGQGLKLLRQEGYNTLKVSKGLFIEPQPIIIDASVTIDGGWSEDFSGKTSLLTDSDYSIISGNNLLTNLITIVGTADVELQGLLFCDTVSNPMLPQDDSSIVIRNSEEIRLNSLIFQNNLGRRGGALLLDASRRIYIDRSGFINNRAELEGGAVVTDNSHFIYFTNNRFLNNRSSQRGGAFYSIISSRVYFDQNEFNANSSDMTGGGLSFASSSNIRVADSFFQGNRSLSATGTGGAIEVTEARDFIIKNNHFLENKAAMAGDISLVLTDSDLTRVIRGNKFSYLLNPSITVRNGVDVAMTRLVIESNSFNLLDNSALYLYAFMEESGAGFNLKGHTFKFNKFKNFGGKEVYRDFSFSTGINSNETINNGLLLEAATSDNEIIN